jgi:hypothetical protein
MSVIFCTYSHTNRSVGVLFSRMNKQVYLETSSYCCTTGKFYLECPICKSYSLIIYSLTYISLYPMLTIQCVADGKGTRAWTQIQNIPMTPLADAPPRNIFFFRGCWYVSRQYFPLLPTFLLVFTTDIRIDSLTLLYLKFIAAQ